MQMPSSDPAFTVLHQLDQKIIYPHYDFKHLTEKYFEIVMGIDDFLIQLVKYWTRNTCPSRWTESGSSYRSTGSTDIPDNVVCFPGHGTCSQSFRPQRAWQHLHPYNEPYYWCVRTTHSCHRGWYRSPWSRIRFSSNNLCLISCLLYTSP